jgi:hypothetical protein
MRCQKLGAMQLLLMINRKRFRVSRASLPASSNSVKAMQVLESARNSHSHSCPAHGGQANQIPQSEGIKAVQHILRLYKSLIIIIGIGRCWKMRLRVLQSSCFILAEEKQYESDHSVAPTSAQPKHPRIHSARHRGARGGVGLESSKVTQKPKTDFVGTHPNVKHRQASSSLQIS